MRRSAWPPWSGWDRPAESNSWKRPPSELTASSGSHGPWGKGSMKRSRRLGVIGVGVLGLLVLPGSAAFGKTVPRRSVFEGPVLRAEGGPGSSPETGLQGQVPLADRESGRSAQGYACNLDLVGRYGRADGFEGAEWQMTWYGHCAYYDTRYTGSQQRRGARVVDVSPPPPPPDSPNLTPKAPSDPCEALKANKAR